MRKEEIARQYEIHKIEVDWKDDTWIALLTSCCTASTILSVIIFSFISFRDPVADARVDCILIWDTNSTNYNYTKSFFPQISHYEGTNRFYLFLKGIWRLGQETRLRCQIGWALLGFDAFLGTIIFVAMLFKKREVITNRSDVESISDDLTKSLTELKMKHKRVRYSCIRARSALFRPFLAFFSLMPGLDIILDLAVLVMWAHGGHHWWFALSLFFQFLSWRFYVIAYWWWASKVSAPLSVGRGMLLWLPVIGPSVAAFTAGFGALNIDKFGFCHGASLSDLMSIDEHERLEFLDDVAHSGTLLELFAIFSCPLASFGICNQNAQDFLKFMREGVSLNSLVLSFFCSLFQSFPQSLIQLRAWQTIPAYELDGLSGTILIGSILLSFFNLIRSSFNYILLQDLLEHSIGCHDTGEALCMAVFTGNLAAARAALALGASPDYASSRGAWANNRVDIVQVDGKRKGTTVQVRKRRAFHALEIAMRKKDLAMAGLLLQNGAKVPKEVLTLFRRDKVVMEFFEAMQKGATSAVSCRVRPETLDMTRAGG